MLKIPRDTVHIACSDDVVMDTDSSSDAEDDIVVIGSEHDVPDTDCFEYVWDLTHCKLGIFSQRFFHAFWLSADFFQN